MNEMKKFQNSILDKCEEWDILKDDMYFSQTKDGYYADYRPAYPKATNGDFTIFQNILTKERKIYGNFGSLVPTINIMEED